MLLWVIDVGFDNTCTVLRRWNGSRVVPRLYGWVYKTLRLSPLEVGHSVVVISARLNPMGSQFSIPLNKWGIKFWHPVENSDTGGPSLTTIRMEYLLDFQYWYCGLCVENQWGRGRKYCFVNFCFFGGTWVIDGRAVMGWFRKSYLGAAETTSFSSRDFSRSNKHNIFWHAVTTGYFYVLFFWNVALSDFFFLGSL